MEPIRWNMSPAEIEQESFRRIEAECDLHRTLSAPHWRVARRLIHTTADMHIADTLVFRHDPVAAGELHFEVRVGKRLDDRAFHFDDITLGQARLPPCLSLAAPASARNRSWFRKHS